MPGAQGLSVFRPRVLGAGRHYVPVLDSRMQRLSESIEGRFQWPEEAVKARSQVTESP